MKLLVIDIQKGIANDGLFNYNNFINDTNKVINAARENNIEVIYVQHDDGPKSNCSIGNEEFDIATQVAPKAGEKIYVKNINSCFGNQDLTEYLSNSDEDTLMIVGLLTNFCIDASVKSAYERGYQVIIPQGTNSTFKNEYMTAEATYKYYNEMMWPNRFANCLSVDEAIQLMQE